MLLFHLLIESSCKVAPDDITHRIQKMPQRHYELCNNVPDHFVTMCLTSSILKFFLSEILTSFHTTSTPSSVSIAKYAASIPGTLR